MRQGSPGPHFFYFDAGAKESLELNQLRIYFFKKNKSLNQMVIYM